MDKERQEILKKLIQGTLSEGESSDLLHDPLVEERMRIQWDKLPDNLHPEDEAGKRIWKRIQSGIGSDNSLNGLVFYKIIAVAASVLLLLGMGAMFFWTKNQADRTIYVVSSGIRSIESVVLPDGTHVRMGSNSRLTYPAHFTGATREIEMTGQAFFNVTENKEKPFIVHTDQMDVTALGTAFEVFNYTDENKLETILKEGKVRVDLKDSDTGRKEEIYLDPDKMLVYDKQNKTLNVKPVNAGSYTAWSRQGMLSFENERLDMILSRLEPWYGRKIKCTSEVASKYRFTFKVKDESLERILFMMSNSSPLKYKETEEEGYYELYVK